MTMILGAKVSNDNDTWGQNQWYRIQFVSMCKGEKYLRFFNVFCSSKNWINFIHLFSYFTSLFGIFSKPLSICSIYIHFAIYLFTIFFILLFFVLHISQLAFPALTHTHTQTHTQSKAVAPTTNSSLCLSLEITYFFSQNTLNVIFEAWGRRVWRKWLLPYFGDTWNFNLTAVSIKIIYGYSSHQLVFQKSYFFKLSRCMVITNYNFKAWIL